MAGLALLLLFQTDGLGSMRTFDPARKVQPFALPGLDGGRHALEDFRGKPVIFSLWATWCAPCRYEMPEFQRARDAFKETHPDAVLMTINIGDGGARARSWMDKQELDMPVLLAGIKFMNDYKIRVVPTVMIFDRKGRLTAMHEGWSQGTDLVEKIGAELDRGGSGSP